MDKTRIEKILNDSNESIKDLHTPDLRVSALLLFLQLRFLEIRKSEFLTASKSALVSRLDGLYRKELLNELDFSIDLLKKYQSTNPLDPIEISDNPQKEIAKTVLNNTFFLNMLFLFYLINVVLNF